MEEWLNNDAVIFDLEPDQIISELLYEGHTIDSAIEGYVAIRGREHGIALNQYSVIERLSSNS